MSDSNVNQNEVRGHSRREGSSVCSSEAARCKGHDVIRVYWQKRPLTRAHLIHETRFVTATLKGALFRTHARILLSHRPEFAHPGLIVRTPHALAIRANRYSL